MYLKIIKELIFKTFIKLNLNIKIQDQISELNSAG